MNFNEMCNIILEAAREYKTKTKTADTDDLADIFSPIGKKLGNKSLIKPNKADITKKVKLKVASPEKTAKKTGSMTSTSDVINKLSNMDLTGLDDEDDTTDTTDDILPVNPITLPDVINNELMAAGSESPEWHMVKALPGYIRGPIRSIGKKVFAPFTSTPIDNINVVANLAGQGPNEDIEINAIASYLDKNGIRKTDAELEFTEIIPDYRADIKIYDAHGITFMLVKDFAGKYIYSWPEDSNKISDSSSSGELE